MNVFYNRLDNVSTLLISERGGAQFIYGCADYIMYNCDAGAWENRMSHVVWLSGALQSHVLNEAYGNTKVCEHLRDNARNVCRLEYVRDAATRPDQIDYSTIERVMVLISYRA